MLSVGRLRLQTKVLLMQMGVIVLVAALISGAVISILVRVAEQQAGERVLGIAHTVALMPDIRAAFDSSDPPAIIQPLAESVRQAADLGFVVVANRDLIRYSHPNADLVGKSLQDPPLPNAAIPEDDARALRGESFVVEEDGSLGRSIRAKVPLYAADESIIGEVSVGVGIQRIQDVLLSHLPELAGAGALALLLGTSISFLVARHVKGQMLGLEPAEIASLFEQREAMLQGIREGVVAVDRAGLITVVNGEARRLLEIPPGVEGWPIQEVLPESGLSRVLSSGTSEADQSTSIKGRAIVVSRVPVRIRGRLVGAIATFRDQTELEDVARELQGARTSADTLRAQAHEFANKLHTIAGMLELGWHQEAVAYITSATRQQQEWIDTLPRRIGDPPLAALLIGKASVASERGITFALSPESQLRTHDGLGDVLATIVGNLVNNAFDAVEGQPRREVTLHITDSDGDIHLEVRDSGPGVPSALMTRVFEAGYSTKTAAGGQRGIGLALVKRLVAERAGEVTVHNHGGAVFSVRLPLWRPNGAQRNGKTRLSP